MKAEYLENLLYEYNVPVELIEELTGKIIDMMYEVE